MSIINNALQGKKVIVTGATGFIGSHLAQRLATVEGANVVGFGRDVSKVPHLAEAGVELNQADLTDAALHIHKMKDADVVFHVAGWMNYHEGDFDTAYLTNVTGTENVVQWAGEAGAKRVVHVSAAAVYGIQKEGVITEETPIDTKNHWVFAHTKASADKQARNAAEFKHIDLTIIRPSFVYGPGSVGRSARIIKWLNEERPLILGDGDGHNFPTYVGNVVDALLIAAVHDKAVGEIFNISDGTVTWKEWFTAYGKMIDKEPKHISHAHANMDARKNDLFKQGKFLTHDILELYDSKAEFSTEKAKNLLGYEPRVSLDDGLKATEAWLREAGYIA